MGAVITLLLVRGHQLNTMVARKNQTMSLRDTYFRRRPSDVVGGFPLKSSDGQPASVMADER